MKKEIPAHFPNAAFDVVVMAASAGGLTALSQILGVSIIFNDQTRYYKLQEKLQPHQQDLETAYEKLQPANEELETTNEEL